MFQPAEEIFSGANSMIEAGILQSPKVDTAVMIHVMAGLPIPEGTAIVCAPGVSAPSADIFTIEVSGKGCHGSMPNEGIDPITASAHILIALQEIQSRELALSDNAVLTIGSFIGGNAPNVIPDKATLRGSIRTFDEQVRKHIKERLTEIASGIATTFRCTATVTFDNSCPTLYNDEKMSADTYKYAKELLGSNALSVAQMQNAGGSKSAGSEDFAHISQLVPSIMIALSAGQPKNGYKYPQHHPKVMFNESVLPTGSALLAYIATWGLFDNKSDNK
jgi:hippurate hydrolase